MARINTNKQDLVPGFSGPPDLFRKMGLSAGQTFTNKHGTKLIVESANFSDKWYVQPLEDTELEKKTESILSNIGIDSQHYQKQFHPEETSRNYRIDFAIPSIRLAIEPHASYLWDVNNGQEAEKERNLNEIGWDVLWLDENDLSDGKRAKAEIKATIRQVIENIDFERDDGSLTLIKAPLNDGSYVSYPPEESNNTVVYGGAVVPRPVAELKQQVRDSGR